MSDHVTAEEIARLVLAEIKPILTDLAENLKAVDHGVGNALHRIGVLEEFESKNRETLVDLRNELAKMNIALFEHMKKSGENVDEIGARLFKLEEWKDRGGGDESETRLVEEG